MHTKKIVANRLTGILVRWFAVAVCLGWAAALAEEDFSRGMLDRVRAIEAARAVDTNRYPDAQSVLVDGIQRSRYEADGTYVEWQEEYVKILTEDGRRDYVTLSSHFTIPYQRGPEDCKITLVEIVKSDGRAVPIDVAAQSRVMIDSSGMAANIYNPNDKILSVSVAGLEVGDVLHYVFFDRIVQPRMRDTWCDWLVLEGPRPIVRQTIEIDGPTNRPLLCIALKDEVKDTVVARTEPRGDRVLYRWEAREVPRMFPEPDMPSLHTVVQRLLVSTAPDWATVSRWYWALSKPHLDVSPAMKAEVDKLTEGMNDRRRKIEALFQFVSQQIRYMGITVEAEAPGYEPHDAKDTFEARHGVCRDKAALLVALLRAAGFEAFPTLINVGPKMDGEIPIPYFNHAIVAVREADGSYLLMDPTNETTTRLLPSYLDDRSYLVATPEGDPLRTSPVDPAENNMLRVATTARLTDDGEMTADTTLRFDGINDAAYRGRFARQKPEERQQYFEGLVKHALPGARLCSLELLPADMMDVSQPLSARFRYQADDVLVFGRETAALALPTCGARMGVVNVLIGRTGLKTRKYPLVTEMACGVDETVAVELPADLGSALSLPAAEPVETELMTWRMEAGRTNRTLTAHSEFKLKGVEFKPAEYGRLKDTLRRMDEDRRRVPVFAGGMTKSAPRENGDAVVLEETVTYTVQDAHTWTEDRTFSKQILTYAGKKQGAEIKIAFNPVWEEVALKEAVVTTDGTERAVRPQEVNVMDAAWVGGAPRYPASKLMVISLPAVEIGSTIRVRFVRTCRDRPFFSCRESFQGGDEIRRKLVRLDVPSRLRLEMQVRNDSDPLVRSGTAEAGRGRKVYEWSARNAAAIRAEEMQPPRWSFVPTLFVSGGDWDSYAGVVAKALRKAAGRQRTAQAKARELIADAADTDAKLKAIRDFVAVQIRETGPALHELPLSCVTPADRTLAEGYGNAADVAVLLFAMLKEVGVEPEFVLASPEVWVPGLVDAARHSPWPALFPSVLVRVPEPSEAGDGFVYLGDSDQYAALGATPHAGCFGLSLPDGELEEICPPRTDRSVTDWTIALKEDGDATLTRKELVYGNAYGAEKRHYAEMTPEERRREFQEMVAEIAQGSEAVGDLTTDFSDYPGLVEYTVRVPKYGVRDGDCLYVALPELLGGLIDLKADTRRSPIFFTQRRDMKTRVTLQMPRGFEVDHAPEALERGGVAAAGLEAAVSVSCSGGDGGSIAVEAQASGTPAVAPADRYPDLLDLARTLGHPRLRMLVLKQSKVK